MAEFSLIERYCQDIGSTHSSTKIGVGDDAAVVQVPSGQELVISVDTMVEGVHFTRQTSAELIAHKLAAVNLSDMAAMGARPMWATLALTIASIEDNWLNAFSSSLDSITCAYGVQLIGGDTTRGPLTLTMQIMGLVKEGYAITRTKSSPGDDVYVSGLIGDPGLALAAIDGKVTLSKSDLKLLRERLDRPTPQVELGLRLSGLATACIDISDGVLADLTHIAKMSAVGMQLDLDKLPLSATYRNYLDNGGSLDIALTGGDDYQLAFSAPVHQRDNLNTIADQLNVPISRIGKVTAPTGVLLEMRYLGKPYTVESGAGYQHFS